MDEKKKKDKAENTPENAPDAKTEDVKKTEQPDSKEPDKGDSEPPESTEGTKEVPKEEKPDTSETDSLKAENLRLKAQIEAYKAGFRADVLEDAVLLAGAVAERDGVEITQALQTIAEKYPDWKNQSETGGFRVGAESPQENTPDDSRLDEAFGIRKRG